MTQLFTNNASGTNSVLLPNEAGPSSLTLQTSEGALFPAPTGADFFICTIEDTGGNIEILNCTDVTGDVLTVVRAQENTATAEFATGSRVELRLTAGTFGEFVQQSGDQMTGELDMNGQVLRDPIITDGEARNVPLRGTDGGTANEIVVPTAGGAPTLGGDVIYHVGNTTFVDESLTITGGEGINTAALGDLSTNRTVDLDITELTPMSGTDVAAADDMLVYDVTAAAHKRVAYQSAGIPMITDSGQTVSPSAAQVNSMFLCTHSAAAIDFEIDAGVGEKGNIIIVQQSDATRQVTVAGTGTTINSAFAGPTTVNQFSVLICVCTATNVWTVYGHAV